MASALQLRRGTTTQHSTFTGLTGEVTVDTTKKTVVVHDGATAGGTPLAKEADLGKFVRHDTDAQGLSAAQKTNARKNIGAAPVPSGNGIIAATGTDTTAARQLRAGSGISISNPDGVAGDPTIANTGVLSVNGQTGDVVLQAGVTSVNGQTGDVSLSLTAPVHNAAFFTANGQFTVPEGVTRLLVTVIGGGGGGTGVRAVNVGTSTTNYYAVTASGGGGGCGKALIPVTPGQVIPVTVGGGGAGGVPSTSVRAYAGAAGGTSSFGTYVTCTGGASGGGGTHQTSIAHVESPARAAKGSFSASADVLVAVDLGEDYMGVTPGPSYTQNVGLDGRGFGAGGGGVIRYGLTTTGGAGTQGCVLIEW